MIHFHVDYANLITDVYVLSAMHHPPGAPKPTQWYRVPAPSVKSSANGSSVHKFHFSYNQSTATNVARM